jgi:hypothetical protein
LFAAAGVIEEAATFGWDKRYGLCLQIKLKMVTSDWMGGHARCSTHYKEALLSTPLMPGYPWMGIGVDCQFNVTTTVMVSPGR